MAQLRELTIEEVTNILAKGTFGELLGTVEHTQLECKNGLYDTKSPKNKIELAKDVSAIANSNGGYLLIGPATTKNPLHHGDEITSVSDFISSLFQPDTYRNILNALIYPPIPDLKLNWHPSSTDPSRGIASIYVPNKSGNDKPFLVVQSNIDSQVRGHLFGHFERTGDDALPTSIQVLRDAIKDGKRYGDLERRLESIEVLLAKLVSAPTNHAPFKNELLLQRAADTRNATQLSVPSFSLLAAPLNPIKLNGLYSSQSIEYQAINNPPIYRQHGFDVNPHTPIQHVRGELIRRVAGRKVLELWQDGSLIFLGRNDEDFLGWAVPRKGTSLYINNYVLTEVVTLFLTLAIKLYEAIAEKPERARAFFGFQLDELGSLKYELSHIPVSSYGSAEGRTVSAENKNFSIDFEPQGAIPEVEALRLLKEIYHWFGITDEDIPYVDFQSKPERIDKTYFSK